MFSSSLIPMLMTNRCDTRTVKQLRDSHGWTSEDTAKLQQGMTEYYVRYPYSLAPETLPDDDRDGNSSSCSKSARLAERLTHLLQGGPRFKSNTGRRSERKQNGHARMNGTDNAKRYSSKPMLP